MSGDSASMSGPSVASGATLAKAEAQQASATTRQDFGNNHINSAAFAYNAAHNVDHTVAGAQEDASHPRKPSDVGLHLETQMRFGPELRSSNEFPRIPQLTETEPDRSIADTPPRPAFITRRSYETRKSFETTSSFRSPSSTNSSPGLAPLGDVTPLPSPIVPSFPREQWRGHTRPHSDSNTSLSREENMLPPAAFTTSPQRIKKSYGHLSPALTSAPFDKADTSNHNHNHNRSISDYTPEPLTNTRPRNVTIPNVIAPAPAGNATPPSKPHMHREEHLSKQPKLLNTHAVRSLPSPPASTLSTADSDEGEEDQASLQERLGQLGIRDATTREIVHWRPLKRLGRGAFSEVILAANAEEYPTTNPPLTPADCVAIKIVAHDPISGPNEERMETSIRREIEVLQSISHPCLPHMSCYDESDHRALLVLNFCPGGDLFDLASQRREILTPPLMQRIFAEIVAATRYLHAKYIVHRDIKLENVLFNTPAVNLPTDRASCSTYPYSLITLTDLGLSKRIPEPPGSPLLTHPCGSADYAAPELLLGQPYDGRATDAWALGVLLYALLESRLPFDPPPRGRGKRWSSDMRSVKHRIARCDWLWCERGDDSGEWDPVRAGPELEGANDVVEGLLKKVSRGRWSVEKVASHQWVKDALSVEGGLRSPVDASKRAATL